MSSSIAPLLGWRDYLHVRLDRVRGDADEFCARARDIRDLVSRSLSGGMSEGAEQALNDIGANDVVDFCIMVDLANGVDIPDVEPLEEDSAEWLSHWLEEEPWRALAVDTDITVCAAMLRSYGESEEETIWHMGDPHMLRSISQVFEAVDREQYVHFVGEINAIAQDPKVRFDAELIAMISAAAEGAAERLGIEPPVMFR